MKTIYLHIGSFKTGSTSIQHFLHNNREKLSSIGYLVPKSQIIEHHPLPLSVIKDFSSFRAAWPNIEGNSKTIWDEIFNEIENSCVEKIIISSEVFCDFSNDKVLKNKDKVITFLEPYFSNYNVTVICYVRAIVPCIQSIYKEAIKAGGITSTFSQEIEIFMRNNEIHLHPTKYLDFFSELFGKENLIVKKYDRENLLEGNVIKDFLQTIDPNLLNVQGFAFPAEENKSLEFQQVDLIRALNFIGLDEATTKTLSNTLIQETKAAVPFTQKQLADLQAAIEKQNKIILEDYNLSIEEEINLSNDCGATHNNYTHAELFQTSLVGYVIKEQARISMQLNTIEKKLDKLLEQDKS